MESKPESKSPKGTRKVFDDAAPERGRFSSARKADAVVRVLRGESLDAVSRELGVTAAKLAEWRDQFLVGGQVALKSRNEDVNETLKKDMQAKIGELMMENELLRERARRAEANHPLASRRSKR